MAISGAYERRFAALKAPDITLFKILTTIFPGAKRL